MKLKRTELYIIVNIQGVDFYYNRENLEYDGCGTNIEAGDTSMGFIKKEKKS